MLVSKRKATEMGLLEAQGRYRRRMDLSCFLGFRDALVLSQQSFLGILKCYLLQLNLHLL